MQILWKNHPFDKTKNGTKEHISESFADVAIGYGQAEYVKPAPHGSREWLMERLRISAAVTAPSEYDTPAPFAAKESWSVVTSHYGSPAIQWRSGSESTLFGIGENFVPSNCPADVRKLYEKTMKEHSARLEAAARERREVESGRR
jgi:hypothetical protein